MINNLKQYTDENYIPISDLVNFGHEFVQKTKQYRRAFMEIVALNDIDFVNLVETPTLIKKRFSKNVDIKGLIDIESQNNDYILEMAKLVVSTAKLWWLPAEKHQQIVQKYQQNNNDLTIVTNYLINNIDHFINNDDFGTLTHNLHELSKHDRTFIKACNNLKLNYSIHDYQKITNCSYETGRKSLEKLSSSALYDKNKIGKKFVYKPTQKLMLLLKEGKTWM